MDRRNKFIFGIFLAIYLAVIVFLCFWHFSPILEMEKTFLGIPMDKIAHFTMFFPFPILAFLTFHNGNKSGKHSFLLVIKTFIIGCIIAASTEIGQSFTTYRDCDIKDFIADFISLTVSSIIVLSIWYLINRTKQNDT
jgi:VanZ family protein